MKATIAPPQEREVCLRMTENQAKTLASLAPNIDYRVIINVGGDHVIATKGDALFKDIDKALRNYKEEAYESLR